MRGDWEKNISIIFYGGYFPTRNRVKYISHETNHSFLDRQLSFTDSFLTASFSSKEIKLSLYIQELSLPLISYEEHEKLQRRYKW